MPSHMPELDGVRGMAILLVLAVHTVPRFVPLGWTGVVLFFVLSGFLITGILLDGKSSGVAGARYFRVFYLKRSIRIFPIYYLTLLAVFVVGGLMDWPRSDLPWYLSYLQNFKINWDPLAPKPEFPAFMNQTWSLAVEEQFYIVWPWPVFCLNRRQLAGVCVGFLTCAPFLRLYLSTYHPATQYYYTLLPSQLDSLAAGALLAIVVREMSLPALRRAAVWFTCLCAAGVILFLMNPANDPLRRSMLPYFFVAAVALPILFPGGPLAKFCRASPLRYFGKISYGLYLYHPIVYHLTPAMLNRYPSLRASLGEFGEGLIGLSVSLAVSALSWHWFESRVNALKRRLS